MDAKNMRWIFLSCLGGLFLGAGLNAFTTQQAPSLSSLADQQASVTKLEWLTMKAQVDALTWTLYENFQIPVIPLNSRYDSDKDAIVWNAVVNSTWLSKANVEEVKKVFGGRAATYCFQNTFLGMVLAQSPVQFYDSDRRMKCYVSFFVWAVDENGGLSRKDVAAWEGGRLILE